MTTSGLERSILRTQNRFDITKWESQVRDLETAAAQTDVIAICYHGASRSGNFLKELRNTLRILNKESNFVGFNTGINFIAQKIPNWLSDKEKGDLCTAIGKALSKTKSLVLFVDQGSLSTKLESDIFSAIEAQAKDNGTEVFYMTQGDRLDKIVAHVTRRLENK